MQLDLREDGGVQLVLRALRCLLQDLERLLQHRTPPAPFSWFHGAGVLAAPLSSHPATDESSVQRYRNHPMFERERPGRVAGIGMDRVTA